MALKIKRRCIRCLTVLRENGTCPNEDCPKYVPEVEPDVESDKNEAEK